ncbi:hypothetical protein ACFX13_041526 [Malus domestica]
MGVEIWCLECWRRGFIGFHAYQVVEKLNVTTKQRRCNKIRGLEDDEGVWSEEAGTVDVIAVNYSEGHKSLGPDGFTGSFFHEYWEVLGTDIIKDIILKKLQKPKVGSQSVWADVDEMVKAFWHSGKLLKKVNHTLIVLIPKVASLRKMTQLRLISLCNVIYKVITKLITSWLMRVLPRIISSNQSTFVAGRQIQDYFGGT